MVRIMRVGPSNPLRADMFEPNHYLRFDLEQPKEIIVIPTKYRSLEDLEEGITLVVEKMKATREKFIDMGQRKALHHALVSNTIQTAEMLVHSLQFQVKRHYENREEGLRILQQRKYAALRDTGLAFPFKYAGITLRYSVEARSKWFSFKSWRRTQELEDGLDKLKRYSSEALYVSNGNEPSWGHPLS
ncbi:hypothetical protein FBEOM_11091 [Fusarium beomiforme]|uniref:Uncharacterized protein n=1 Tax=Fusarium beomiforme TaxID=44412 RepID=A0A9P5AB83_9HYPO|nr:hypothetical protein FBEOM_11091 [Fusarium beomiforme]